MYEYKAKIIRVIDGDTYDLDVDLGFGLHNYTRMRLAFVNTPEKRGVERPQGLAVTEQVKKLIEGKDVLLQTHKWKGKYGRFVCSVKFRAYEGDTFGTDLGHYLLQHDMAKKVDY